jgi:hypothetical protein
MVNKSMTNIGRSTVLEHVLPKGEVGQKSNHVALEVFGEEAHGVWIGLHLGVVRELQNERQAFRRVKDGQQSVI